MAALPILILDNIPQATARAGTTQVVAAAASAAAKPAKQPPPVRRVVAPATTSTSAATTTTTAAPTTTTAPPETTTTEAPPPPAPTTTAPPPPPPPPTTAPPTTAPPGNVQEGGASWYDYQPGTCAHRTLPFGTVVTVTNLATGGSATCTVADRGPFIAGRIIDLDRTVFEQLAPLSAGVINVRITW